MLLLARRSSPRQGFSLTELAIVLGVIGLILGAVWSGASVVFQRQRVNDQVQQLKILSDNIRGMYVSAKTFPLPAGDITAAMVAAGVVPSYMMVPGKTNPQSVDGGDIIIYYLANGFLVSAPQIEFAVNMQNTCNGVLSYFAGLAADLNITGIYSNAGPNANVWQSPANNALDSTSFGACTLMAFQFNLHN